jgi:multimeric flavodoxin WrbA
MTDETKDNNRSAAITGAGVGLVATYLARSGEGIPMTKVAVIYYSATGNVHALAEAVAEGAAETGAQVRLRRVAELAPAEAIDSNPAWRAHVDATADIHVATIDGVRWADGLALGSPTQFGNISAQLKQFLRQDGFPGRGARAFRVA